MDFSVPLLFLLSTLTNTGAHRSLPSGITCGSQFSSADTALVIPNSEISWANYGIYTCEHPVMWYEVQSDEQQQLKFTVTVPVIDRFENARMSVAIIGPGLEALQDDDSLPDSVKQYAIDMGMGAMIYNSPQDQSSCDHLTSPEMISEVTVKDRRCHFYEPFGGSNLWVILDDIITLPEAATYKIAVFEESGSTAKASFACCDWPEDFVSPYNIPETTCPLCGANTSNPAWASLFFEQKSMEDFGGYPPMQSCKNYSAPILLPSGDACPPEPSGNDINQPASCALGCNNGGECHSHNVFGECTHLLTWTLEPKFGEANVNYIVIFKGDKIRFTSATTTHNLYKLMDKNALEECSFQGSDELAGVEDISIGHDVTFNEAGIYYYTCGIGCGALDSSTSTSNSSFCHCQIGQKLTVEVKDATEGLRCHDHKQPHHNHNNNQGTKSVPLTCLSGTTNVRAVNNPTYGAMNENECSEQCAPTRALDFMTDVERGSCSDLDFTSNPTELTLTPEGSPMAMNVVIVTKSSTCHCHSYEEIACPEDETSDDTLYAEHIEEIDNYCAGILESTEDDCPYKCFQPMEVLHLHYLECPSRSVSVTYKAVNATNKCHIAATAPPGTTDCAVVDLNQDKDPLPSTASWYSIASAFAIIPSTIIYMM